MSAIITAGTVDRIGKDELMKLEIGVEKTSLTLCVYIRKEKLRKAKFMVSL